MCLGSRFICSHVDYFSELVYRKGSSLILSWHWWGLDDPISSPHLILSVAWREKHSDKRIDSSFQRKLNDEHFPSETYRALGGITDEQCLISQLSQTGQFVQ